MLDGNTEKLRRRESSSNLQTLRALIPLVLFGYLMALCSLPVAGWPTGQFGQQNVETVRHFERITHSLISEGDSANLPRRILDVSFYLVLFAGLVFLVLVWRRGNRNPLMGLVGVAILGLSYAGGMALYTGAFMSMCGFLLMLMTGIVMLTAARDDDETDTIEPDTETTTSIADTASDVESMVDEPTAIDPINAAMQQADTTDLDRQNE